MVLNFGNDYIIYNQINTIVRFNKKRPELLVKNPLWIASNKQNIVTNFYQDFVACTQQFLPRTEQQGPVVFAQEH